MRQRPKYASLAILAIVAATLGSHATAHAEGATSFGDYTQAAPKEMNGIGITERVGAELPGTLRFRDHTGALRTVGDVFVGNIPTILTFNYTSCPQLCSMQLTGLAKSIAATKLTPGQQFQVVTVIIEATETVARAVETRQRYIDMVTAQAPEVGAALGGAWTLLLAETPGDDAAIKALAASVGFGYKWIPERSEFGHAAAAILITPRGAVSRYLGGIQFPDALLDTSLFAAAAGQSSEAAGMFMRCFMYEKHEGAQKVATSVMRWGTFAFVVVFIAGLIGFTFWRNLRGVRTQHEIWSKLP